MAPAATSDATANIGLKEALATQRSQADFDCLPCRLMGSAAFTGLGIYTYASGMSQLRQQKAVILKSGSRFGILPRKISLYAMSGLLVGLGAYRLIN